MDAPTLTREFPDPDSATGASDRRGTLSADELSKMNAYWRAANYLSVGQIYLYDNPLLREPLTMAHVKPLVVGHWGTTPGQNFIYVHLNRVIKKYDLDMIYIAGPGHGGPAIVGNVYLEGTWSEVYPNVTLDEAGLSLFKQFSFPGGISSHVAPTTPGSIHEGGELGYSLSHAFGAAFDNPELIVACVVGDGEAETGPLATAWQSNKLLDPITDGAVLPILHLNGYKISNPTVLARIEHEELEQFLRGCGWTPYFVEGDDPTTMHELMATVLDRAIEDIRQFQTTARTTKKAFRPRWPVIVLRSPKGWTGPKIVDGLQVEGTFRAHQVPLLVDPEHPEHVAQLQAWMKSYKAEELFNADGRLIAELAELAPKGDRRMGANPHANGGILLHDLHMPDFREHAVRVPTPGAVDGQDTLVLGKFLRDVVKLNEGNFRVFGPDETLSNLLGAVFEVTNRQWDAKKVENDEFLAPAGRVLDSMLSEHQCEGWLEGYLLTGRHGMFNSYEAFIRIVDSMFSQHAKWLKVTSELPWRRKIASLNYLLASHVWQQDHNGFTHQDPGFLDHVINKKADIVRVYLPPDANCLLSTFDHCLRSRHYVNVVVAGKHALPQWLTMDEAVIHCTQGLGIWQWASNDQDSEPDVVMACCGDTPTLEVLAAVSILRQHLPDLKIRVINVVDLMKLQSASEHPHGLSDQDYDSLFTKDRHIVFGFHGYPWLVHRLTYRRTNRNLHVRGYKEEGTITTAFDMRVQNDLDRFHLVQDVVDRLPHLAQQGSLSQANGSEQACRTQALHRPAWPGPARDPELEVGHLHVTPQPLVDTACRLVADGKGLLAMDESNPTCNRRFASAGIPQTEEARRAYRELIITTPCLGESISGVILYDETIRQQTNDGIPFLKILTEAGIIPGIKVDTGAKDLAGRPGEKITEGLDGLRDRLLEYFQMGARFAKWRAVIALGDGLPSYGCIEANAQALARYAALCQEAGLVPIVEPEVLMAGEHTLEQCRQVTEATLRSVFDHLCTQGVMLEGMILKPNMVLPGLSSTKTAGGGRGGRRHGWGFSQGSSRSRSGDCVPVGWTSR